MAFTGGTVEVRIMDVVPAQTGHAGEILTTDGTGLEWTPNVAGMLYLAQNYV